MKKWMSRAGGLSDGGLGGGGGGAGWEEVATVLLAGGWRLGLGREAAPPGEAQVASEMLQTARRQA